MSHFALRCLRTLNLRVAKNVDIIRQAHRAFDRTRLAPVFQNRPAPPRNLLLLLTTVYAASLDETEEPPFMTTFESENVTQIRRLSDLEDTLSNAGDKLVVVFCMVRWCPFCRKIAPTVEEIANKGTQDLVMLKLDMDDREADSSRIISRYGAYYMQQGRYAVGLPTFLFLRGGTKLEHFSSADDDRLRGTVRKYTA